MTKFRPDRALADALSHVVVPLSLFFLGKFIFSEYGFFKSYFGIFTAGEDITNESKQKKPENLKECNDDITKQDELHNKLKDHNPPLLGKGEVDTKAGRFGLKISIPTSVLTPPSTPTNKSHIRFVAIINERSGGQLGAKMATRLRTLGIPSFNLFHFYDDEKADATYDSLIEALFLDDTYRVNLLDDDRDKEILCDIETPSIKESNDDDSLNKEANDDDTPKEFHMPTVLCGGGDGSYWQCVHVVEEARRRMSPDCSGCIGLPNLVVVPLGTGNDLSNALGWGKKAPNVEKLENLLDLVRDQTEKCELTGLDRWALHWTEDQDSGEKGQCWGRPLPERLLCYFSVGWDASIALRFETERQQCPDKFSSPFKNNWRYTMLGAGEFFRPSEVLNGKLKLVVDGEEIHIPADIRSLKFVNIRSAQSGLDFWGPCTPRSPKSGKIVQKGGYMKLTSNRRDFECESLHPPACDDGVIEVVATQGLRHMLGIRAKMDKAFRLAQGSVIELTLLESLPVQTDGEAWMQQPCNLAIKHRDKVPMVVGPKKPKGVTYTYRCLEL